MSDITPDQLREILEAHKKWVESDGKEGSRAYLSYTNLSNADLSNADLRDADLSGANFFAADLSSAKLNNAKLYGANFYGTNLSKTNLSGTDLGNTNLFVATLSEANLSDANLSEANLRMTNLPGANLPGANLNGARLREAELKDANLKDSVLVSADLEDADLTGVDISGANIFHYKTHGWEIEGIKCTHVYNCPYEASKEEREKSRINFKEGEFEAKYKTMPTIELVLSGGLRSIDQYKMGYIINEANREYKAGLEISSMKKGFEGIEVMLEAKSDKDLEKIGHMIAREYKKRDLDSKLLAIFRKEKLLGSDVEGADINSPTLDVSKIFSHPLELKVNLVNKGTINIIGGDVKGNAIAIGQGAKATTIINNYTKNKEEIDKTLEAFKKEVSEGVRQQVEVFTDALKEKDEKKASGAWEKIKKMVAKADEVVKTGEKAAKLTRTAIDLYYKLEGLF